MALDQPGPPGPPAAAGQVAGGPPSALGQVAEVAEAVGQVAGAAAGQGGGGGCWVGGQAGELSRAGAGGDQGGKLCSMQMHGQGEERKKKKEEKRKVGNCATYQKE